MWSHDNTVWPTAGQVIIVTRVAMIQCVDILPCCIMIWQDIKWSLNIGVCCFSTSHKLKLFSENCVPMHDCLFVCIFVCLSITTWAKTLHTKSSLYAKNGGHRESVLNLKAGKHRFKVVRAPMGCRGMKNNEVTSWATRYNKFVRVERECVLFIRERKFKTSFEALPGQFS